MFLATACMMNKAASLESQVTPVPCKLINICLKQLDDPTMNTTSLISSETFRRKSAKSSPSSSKPSCYSHITIMLHSILSYDNHSKFTVSLNMPWYQSFPSSYNFPLVPNASHVAQLYQNSYALFIPFSQNFGVSFLFFSLISIQYSKSHSYQVELLT